MAAFICHLRLVGAHGTEDLCVVKDLGWDLGFKAVNMETIVCAIDGLRDRSFSLFCFLAEFFFVEVGNPQRGNVDVVMVGLGVLPSFEQPPSPPFPTDFVILLQMPNRESRCRT